MTDIRYSALFDHNNDGVFIIDLEGRHIDVNQQAADMLGYTRDELLNMPMHAFVVPDERVSGEEVKQQLLAGDTMPIYERHMRRKDGSIITAELNVALVRDEDGTPLHFQSIARDVTQRNKMFDELLERRRMLQMVIEAMPNALLVVNTEQIIESIFVPAGFPSIWATRQLHPNLGLADALPDALYERLTRELAHHTDATKHIFTVECEAQKAFLEITISTVAYSPSKLIVIKDATALRQTAAELSAIQARQRLARDLHDGATQHLSAASLLMDVITRLYEKDPELALNQIEKLRTMTRGALAEMRMLLHELRPESLVSTALHELVQQMAEIFEARTQVAIQVQIDGEPWDLPPEVHVAAYRIMQESLSNIAKHAHARQVTLSLHYMPDCFTAVITDDGRGFDPAAITGGHFGVSFMGERADDAGIDLTVDSEIDRGTTVTVRWER